MAAPEAEEYIESPPELRHLLLSGHVSQIFRPSRFQSCHVRLVPLQIVSLDVGIGARCRLAIQRVGVFAIDRLVVD